MQKALCIVHLIIVTCSLRFYNTSLAMKAGTSLKHPIRAFSLAPLFTLVMLLGLLASPLSASAAAHNQAHAMRTKGTQRQVSARGSNLIYNGGPVVEGTANVFAIFWEPTGSVVSTNYNSLIQRFVNDVHGTVWYQILSQYKDSSGAGPVTGRLAGTFVDTRSYPSNPMFDSDVQAEVSHAQSLNGWTSSNNNLFLVFTAKNENECFDTTQSECTFTTFCGYHSFFGTNTIYAFLPYTGTSLSGCGVPRTPNNNIDADSTINVTSHEFAESVTDPLLNAWFDSSGQEIGDKCNFNFATTNSANGDTILNGDAYEIQQEWSNTRRACRLNTL